jgi:hypothetical protein
VPNGTVYARTRSVTVCFEPRSGSKVSIELSIRRGLMACFDDGEIVGPWRSGMRRRSRPKRKF